MAHSFVSGKQLRKTQQLKWTTLKLRRTGDSFTSRVTEIADKQRLVRSSGVTDCTKTATEFHPLSLFSSRGRYIETRDRLPRRSRVLNSYHDNIRNVRRDLSVLFTTRQTSKRIMFSKRIMLTVPDLIQINSKTTHKDTGTQVNTFCYFIS